MDARWLCLGELAYGRRMRRLRAADLSATDAVAELYTAARDDELPLLDELVERAGLGWKCRAEAGRGPCLFMNVDASRCGGCGATNRDGNEESDD